MISIIVGFVFGFFASYFAQWPTPPRQLWNRWRFRRFRERRCYTLPGSKTYIIPACSGDTASPYVSANALGCVKAITGMLQQSGYSEGHDFDLVFPNPSSDNVAEDIRTENLILVCGPRRNQFLASLLDEFPDLMRDIVFDSDGPAFVYRGKRYTAERGRDWGLVLVKKNPYNLRRKLVILFGLTSVGTKGAGLFYARDGSASDRMRAADILESTHGEIEILLSVEHTEDRQTVRRMQPLVLTTTSRQLSPVAPGTS
ncbi:MAG TPA: hypothetical protein VF006_17140 [Longimicrobium sp.]